MRSLHEFVPAGSSEDLETLQAIQGITVTIVAARFLRGEFSEFSIFECVDGDGQVHHVKSGASMVVSALKASPTQAQSGLGSLPLDRSSGAPERLT